MCSAVVAAACGAALVSHPAVDFYSFWNSSRLLTEGRIADVALSTDVDGIEEPTVLATVQFDRNQVANLRPGATVLARIHCGRRSLGYVWLHDLFEFAQTHWWW